MTKQDLYKYWLTVRNALLRTFVFTHTRRVNLYRNLEMITGSGVSLNETIRLLASKFRKHMPHSFMPLIMDEWLKAMAQGKPFVQALAPWAPGWEMLLLRAGGTAQMTHMFKYVAELSNNIVRLKSGLVSAIRYPMFALLMLFALMYVFSYYVIPSLSTFLSPDKWPPVTKSLFEFTRAFTENIVWVILSVAGLVALIIRSMSQLRAGPARRILNKIPPWSIYKQFHGSIFLLSLASLLRSGVSISQALDMIRSGSSPYVASLLIVMQAKLQAGRPAGEAIQSELFDTETQINLEVYADADKLEDGIQVLAQEQLEAQILKLALAAKMMGNAILLLVVGFIAWNYMGLIALQSSMAG
ncbi:MAG: type II secretion system F family protein [Gammaproteobacteria bacterium]